MRIATWNLERPRHSERRRRRAIAQWLATIDADVWVLTETHDDVRPSDEFTAVSTEVTDRPQETGERWVTIWSRYPIRPLPPTSDPARAVAAYVEPPGWPPLVVYGTVLPWLGSPWQDVPAVDGQAFAAALAAQLSDWRALTEEFPAAMLCVAGDLNQDLSTQHYYGSKRNRAALRAALAEAGLACLTAHPDDPVREFASTRASIDHICVTASSVTHAKSVVRAWPEGPAAPRSLSDHYGVVVELGALAARRHPPPTPRDTGATLLR